jgi:hypothetical protein
MRIRIQIRGFDDKTGKNLQMEKKFFLSKIEIYLSLSLDKGRPSYKRSLHPSKEKI